MGTGELQSGSAKQKINTRSNTEAELVGVDDVITKILWTKLFIEEQGYEVEKNFYSRITRIRFYYRRTGGRAQVGTAGILKFAIFCDRSGYIEEHGDKTLSYR